jgi:hypothetical protein
VLQNATPITRSFVGHLTNLTVAENPVNRAECRS